MDTVRAIERLIEPSLAEMGYDLVRARISSGAHPTLQIMVEHADGATVSIDECAEISHLVSTLLDVEDPIRNPYVLEVSSPGIDRPLTRLKDFDRFSGFEAKLELSPPVEGRRRFRGMVLGTDGHYVLLDVDGERLKLEIDTIQNAKLVLNDKLLAAASEAGRRADNEPRDALRRSAKRAGSN